MIIGADCSLTRGRLLVDRVPAPARPTRRAEPGRLKNCVELLGGSYGSPVPRNLGLPKLPSYTGLRLSVRFFLLALVVRSINDTRVCERSISGLVDPVSLNVRLWDSSIVRSLYFNPSQPVRIACLTTIAPIDGQPVDPHAADMPARPHPLMPPAHHTPFNDLF